MRTSRPWGSAGRSRAGRRAALLLLSGLFSIAVPIAAPGAQEYPTGVQGPHDPIDAHVVEAARRFRISPDWIRAVMRVESAGQLHAVSPKGAMGLMQIMPATWEYLRARHALGNDPFDPRDNILAGTAYLRELHDRYGAPGFLAAYNAGPGRYEASLNGRPLPAETLAYVAALAPAIDGRAAPAPVRIAATDPQAWRRASLFVARSGSSSAASAPSVEAIRDDPRMTFAAPTANGESDTAHQPESLFVRRSRAGEAR